MQNSLVYNIPASMIDSFQGRNLIVRSSSPNQIVYSLWRSDLSNVRFVQLLSTPPESALLEGSAESVPLEIVLEDPATQFHQLYSLANLLDSHPVRVAIPVVKGFGKAVKLAVSLNFSVKLQFGQPDQDLLNEVESILDFYLHGSYVRQPIEFFQTILRSFYTDEPISLWEVAEEDPKQVRYITDDGEETISNRFAGVKFDEGLTDFVKRFGQELISERRECHDCEFFTRCGGYFKWPDKNYSCEGVKRVFRTLANASSEMSSDLKSYEALELH